MQVTFKLICIILALVFFGLATVKIPEHPRFSWLAAGLFCLTLALFVNV